MRSGIAANTCVQPVIYYRYTLKITYIAVADPRLASCDCQQDIQYPHIITTVQRLHPEEATAGRFHSGPRMLCQIVILVGVYCSVQRDAICVLQWVHFDDAPPKVLGLPESSLCSCELRYPPPAFYCKLKKDYAVFWIIFSSGGIIKGKLREGSQRKTLSYSKDQREC